MNSNHTILMHNLDYKGSTKKLFHEKIILFLFLVLVLFFFSSNAFAGNSCLINDSNNCINPSDLNSNNTTLNYVNTENSSFNKIEIYLFKIEGCPHCAEALSFLNSLKEKYPSIELKTFDAASDAELLESFYQAYNVPFEMKGKVPIVFIGNKYFLGDKPIIENIEAEIKHCISTGCKIITLEDKKPVVNELQIIGLALVDSINPCALAVLILLLTAILTRHPEKRHKTLYAGLSFSLSIFLAYFLMGLLIILGFKSVTSLTNINTLIIYKVLGVIAIIFGLLNIKDYVKYGAGGFVMEVPRSWRPLMKKIISNALNAKGAFIIGLIISLFLLPCTSGPYFVANGILSRLSFAKAFPWLLLYNFFFILPMLLITLFVFLGFTAVEEVSDWRTKNIQRLHLIAGIILVVIGLLMVFGLV